MDEIFMKALFMWVIADNSAYQFYQSLGGEPVNQKSVEIGNVQLTEVAYGWREIPKI